MNSKSRRCMIAGVSASALILIAGTMVAPGCNPHKNQVRPESLLDRISRPRGQVIEPRKCMLRVAILRRPFRDRAINEAVWSSADQQSITPEARRTLEANGIRIGVITGEFPAELEAVVQAPPPNRLEPAVFVLDDGDQTLISITEPVDRASLLLNREGRPYGRDFLAASGFFRVTAAHDGINGVSLRFTPEIHHGPIQRSFQPLSQGTPYAPQQFRINDGQQEETLRDLAATLVLEPGQVAVVGFHTEQPRSLGSFLFTESEANSDERQQKLILVWASRNRLGSLSEKTAP
jgi:hypothetical protein